MNEILKLEGECDSAVNAQDVGVALSGVSKSDCCVNRAVVSMMEITGENNMKIEKVELMTEQMNDDVIGPIYKIVEAGVRVEKAERTMLKRESKILLKQLRKLKVVDGVLVRETKTTKQIVLPKVFHQLVYTELHEKLAHLGSEKVFELARMRFYWPKMENDISFYVRKQCRCLIAKKPSIPDRAPLIPIESRSPFEMISVDYVH